MTRYISPLYAGKVPELVLGVGFPVVSHEYYKPTGKFQKGLDYKVLGLNPIWTLNGEKGKKGLCQFFLSKLFIFDIW